ncbi:MAG: endonuclease domain-containing protein [Fidelibacterota bacterium]
MRPFEEDHSKTDNLPEGYPYGEFREHYRYKDIKEICREMRKHPTKSENILWAALRNRNLAGLKFYRQHPFGRFIVDFYCHEKRLVVEVDGGIHRNREVRDYDRLRQEIIEKYRVRFFRCTSSEVESDLERVLRGILKAAQTHPQTPSLEREGASDSSQKR